MPPAAKKKKAIATKKKKKARVRRVVAKKKKKAVKKTKAPDIAGQAAQVIDTDTPLTDPDFMAKLAQVCKYIDEHSRPAKQSPQQRQMLIEIAELNLKYGINVRGQELSEREKEILTGFVQKQ